MYVNCFCYYQGLDLTGAVSKAELEVVAQEVQRADKLKELADSMEMAIHFRSSVQVANLLDRWQKEMEQFNIHTRSHLVHHLRCVNLTDTAHRYLILHQHTHIAISNS